MQDQEIHERGPGIFVPDTLLPTQYFDRVRRRKDMTGEQRLICAIIEDAIDTYRKHAAAKARHHQQLFDEAERWIESEDRTWIYSFETICDYLGLESGYVRNGLRALKARLRGEAPIAVEPPDAPDATAPDVRRAINE